MHILLLVALFHTATKPRVRLYRYIKRTGGLVFFPYHSPIHSLQSNPILTQPHTPLKSPLNATMCLVHITVKECRDCYFEINKTHAVPIPCKEVTEGKACKGTRYRSHKERTHKSLCPVCLRKKLAAQ